MPELSLSKQFSSIALNGLDSTHHLLTSPCMVSDEIICLIWLLRKSGCFYDLFADKKRLSDSTYS